MKKKHHFAILLVLIAGGILFILVHHGLIHDGLVAQEEDFENGIFNLTKSHEGIIIVAVLVLIGIIIGHSRWTSK